MGERGDFDRRWRADWGVNAFAPGVSILKPVKGAEPRMYVGFVSHCTQVYAGEFELLFGVSSLEDAAVAEVARLRVEYPEVAIRLVECPERLGTSGKVSNLVQMLREARFEHIVINDSDILVSPRYLERVMGSLEDAETGLVTVPYIGARGRYALVEAGGAGNCDRLYAGSVDGAQA